MDKTQDDTNPIVCDCDEGSNVQLGPDRSRRRFVRGGTLALPAVMTLHAQSVQAFTSITCGQKALDAGDTAVPVIGAGEDDGYLRETVVVYDELVRARDSSGHRVSVPNGIPTFFYDPYYNVWRDINGNNLGSNKPLTCNDVEGGVAQRRAIVYITASDGSPISCGAASAPTSNAIITSAAGLCMASLVTRA